MERAGFKELCIKSKLPEQLGGKRVNPDSISVLVGGLCDQHPKLPVMALDAYILAQANKQLPKPVQYTSDDRQRITLLILQDHPKIVEGLRTDNLLEDEPNFYDSTPWEKPGDRKPFFSVSL